MTSVTTTIRRLIPASQDDLVRIIFLASLSSLLVSCNELIGTSGGRGGSSHGLIIKDEDKESFGVDIQEGLWRRMNKSTYVTTSLIALV